MSQPKPALIYDHSAVSQEGVAGVPTVPAEIGMRIEMMPWTDLWMSGARFGTVTNVTKDGWLRIKLDRLRKKVLVPASMTMNTKP